ncbi:MAG: assimilatory sulfite reductase (NADPH) flavoprotein subunit [Steroidobacteraceae bacterium]|nr:assimilatory sulfite reductase (NADPH) flavoprotein subunit [Steroidobacteraceae bacterium]
MSTALQILDGGAAVAREADGLSLAPFDAALADEVRALLRRLDSSQRLWLSGYLAGASSAPAAPRAASASGEQSVMVLFGSHSGNGEQLAAQAVQALSARGVKAAALDMLDCRKSHLQQARHLMVIVSTHGEGDPPDRARPLYDLLHSRKAPKLDHLQYSVLALGDSSYERYCETGRRFDAQLEALGAKRLHERVECDVDYQAAADRWMDAVGAMLAQSGGPADRVASAAGCSPIVPLVTAYTRKNPFHAPVLTNQRITARDSTKDVRHIELSIEGADIRYEPGDALGVVPRNHDADVEALLQSLRFDPNVLVPVGGQSAPLRAALTDHFAIGPLSRSMAERYAAATGCTELSDRIAVTQDDQLQKYLRGRSLIDLVTEHPPPASLDPEKLVSALRPLTPRLYSIASSRAATEDEVHLTVSVVEYFAHGRARKGVVSGALAALTQDGAAAPVYVHRNPGFRLPSDPQTAVIMIGAGTGVAPYRAFMAEREALGASGRNWLLFGDRSFRNDFLYQAEWLELRKRGVLQRIDVAFSRDGPVKVYVQHRMRERGRELFEWIDGGAHVYVCGDAESMAPDVERALCEILAVHGGMSPDAAQDYLLDMQRGKRYQKDVY